MHRQTARAGRAQFFPLVSACCLAHQRAICAFRIGIACSFDRHIECLQLLPCQALTVKDRQRAVAGNGIEPAAGHGRRAHATAGYRRPGRVSRAPGPQARVAPRSDHGSICRDR